MLPGVFMAKKKDGTAYYRSSINHGGKHISLGSFPTELLAHKAYQQADFLFSSPESQITDYQAGFPLSFEKWVVLHNFRDNGLYFKTPIYLKKNYFLYYYDPNCIYKFDADDLFYYSNHKIMKRGGHLFVADFGIQENILKRYGIKNYGVAGKDFIFVNGDEMDYRYGNIEIINRYHGVTLCQKRGRSCYITRIHLNGSIIIGRYQSENEAAVAYNKAAEYLWGQHVTRQFPLNYIQELEEWEYQQIYEGIKLPKSKLRQSAKSC